MTGWPVLKYSNCIPPAACLNLAGPTLAHKTHKTQGQDHENDFHATGPSKPGKRFRDHSAIERYSKCCLWEAEELTDPSGNLKRPYLASASHRARDGSIWKYGISTPCLVLGGAAKHLCRFLLTQTSGDPSAEMETQKQSCLTWVFLWDTSRA